MSKKVVFVSVLVMAAAIVLGPLAIRLAEDAYQPIWRLAAVFLEFAVFAMALERYLYGLRHTGRKGTLLSLAVFFVVFTGIFLVFFASQHFYELVILFAIAVGMHLGKICTNLFGKGEKA